MEKKRIAFLVCLILTLILFFYQLSQFWSVVNPDWDIEWRVYRYQEVAFWIVFIADIIIITGAFIVFLSSVKYHMVGSSLCLIAGVAAVITSLYLPFSGPFRNWQWYSYSDIFFEAFIYILILLSALYGYYGRKERAKGSGIADQMKRLYHLSIGLLICGLTLFIILTFISLIIFGLPIGLLLGFIGLFGIILYRFKPEKLRNYLLKREKLQEEPKVQA